ncbi:MAG: hypothetical protein C5B49_01435 [Bdellovibrio sp.]|nr:MAG: hypothetical protein C5B49_01435 [Bdellovibrio sp.]
MRNESNSHGRRQFFKKAGWGAMGAMLTVSRLGRAQTAAGCGLTPPQTEGPFYPGESKFTIDNDLTRLPGRNSRPLGQVIYIQGHILGPGCRPVKGALVEIWQACSSGRYNNKKDTNRAKLDPNFRYWGEMITEEDGDYMFKTIIPGAYPADSDWTRPPHIHFKIAAMGYKELITQMYFAGQSLNDHDLILQQIPKAEQGAVIVEFAPAPQNLEPGSLIGNFDITIESVRG